MGGLAWAVAFHMTNVALFGIASFPWMSLALTALFFPADWPRRVPGLGRMFNRVLPAPAAAPIQTKACRSMGGLVAGWPLSTKVLMGLYLGFHLLMPLRHHLYPGDPKWTEEGQFFAWRMMLRGKSSWIQFRVLDPKAQGSESRRNRRRIRR